MSWEKAFLNVTDGIYQQSENGINLLEMQVPRSPTPVSPPSAAAPTLPDGCRASIPRRRMEWWTERSASTGATTAAGGVSWLKWGTVADITCTSWRSHQHAICDTAVIKDTVRNCILLLLSFIQTYFKINLPHGGTYTLIKNMACTRTTRKCPQTNMEWPKKKNKTKQKCMDCYKFSSVRKYFNVFFIW